MTYSDHDKLCELARTLGFTIDHIRYTVDKTYEVQLTQAGSPVFYFDSHSMQYRTYTPKISVKGEVGWVLSHLEDLARKRATPNIKRVTYL